MDTQQNPDAPSLIQTLGAMLYGARTPLSAADLRRVLLRVAANAQGAGPEKAFAKTKESEVRKALDELRSHLAQAGMGIILAEVADGYRYQTDPRVGPWLRDLLDLGKPARLSRPALETLAIIAYRQPIARAEIEAIRGVAVDAILRTLLEGGLLRIVARSELPGRPLLYGTTQQFLEHFGIKSVNDLPGIDQLARRDAEWASRQSQSSSSTGREETQTTESMPENADDSQADADASPSGSLKKDEEAEDDQQNDEAEEFAEDDAEEDDVEFDNEEDEDDDEELVEDEEDDDDEQDEAH